MTKVPNSFYDAVDLELAVEQIKSKSDDPQTQALLFKEYLQGCSSERRNRIVNSAPFMVWVSNPLVSEALAFLNRHELLHKLFQHSPKSAVVQAVADEFGIPSVDIPLKHGA